MHSVYFGAVSIEIEDYDTGYKIALPMLLNQLKPRLNLMKCSEGKACWPQLEEKQKILWAWMLRTRAPTFLRISSRFASWCQSNSLTVYPGNVSRGQW